MCVAIAVPVDQTANVDCLASAPIVRQRRQTVSAEMRVNVELSANVGQVASVRAVGHQRVVSVETSVTVESSASVVQAVCASRQSWSLASAEHYKLV